MVMVRFPRLGSREKVSENGVIYDNVSKTGDSHIKMTKMQIPANFR